MKAIGPLSAVLLASALASGCTTLKPETVVSPSEVTVEDALKTVGRGLAGMKSELEKEKITTGLLVDEVQLTLALTSK
ncbi:MAG TPA: hypothetical protein PKC88_03025, partial [Plasticicumulans sp.]|nr:hypothetical protein [Plasticicumulans sp.]